MALSSDQVKGIDTLRIRLSQLTNSVAHLRHELETKDPLPNWSTLVANSHAVDYNLNKLTETLSLHAQLLKEAHAYPLPSFPGPSQEGTLNQLLRKKLPPGVENWVYEHTKQQAETPVNDAGALQDEELRELWSWATESSRGIVKPMLEEDGALNDDYTIAERESGVENVVTGTKYLDEDSEDEDEANVDDEESMQGVQPSAGVSTVREDGIDPSQPPIPLESMLRFMTTGALPRGGLPNR